MIDFHCHVDLFPSPAHAVEEIERAGAYVLSVTNTPKAFPKTAQLAKGRKRIKTALGMHPQIVHERHTEVGLFTILLPEAEYVGEIGIDGGEESAHHLALQKEVFERLLRACSDAGGRIMSIHSRHASGEVIEILARNPRAGTAVLHWFTGPSAHAQQATELGAWFSVGLPMLRSQKGAALLAELPKERVLTETDAPFASMNGDSYPAAAISSATMALARIWNCDVSEANRQIQANFKSLLNLKNTIARSHN